MIGNEKAIWSRVSTSASIGNASSSWTRKELVNLLFVHDNRNQNNTGERKQVIITRNESTYFGKALITGATSGSINLANFFSTSARNFIPLALLPALPLSKVTKSHLIANVSLAAITFKAFRCKCPGTRLYKSHSDSIPS